MSTEYTTTNNTVYQIVTEHILAQLEAGVAPWRQPWKGSSLPCNMITLRPYRGINALLLGMAPFTSPYYLTFKQVQELGGTVKKGSKSQIVVFWKFFNETEGEEEEQNSNQPKGRRPALLRYYRVFNFEQTEGLENHLPERNAAEFEPIDEAAKVIENMPQRPKIAHKEQRAFYSPKKDVVNLPLPESFISPSDYYATAFHELTHSTGHKSRLNRPSVANTEKLAAFGSPDYSKEELIAELGSAFVCASVGIQNTLETSAAYLQGWLDVLREDSRMIVTAASAAQKAADFILGQAIEQN